MYKVCAMIDDKICLLEEFECKPEAEEFMLHDYVLFYKDEMEEATEDEVIHPEEMFILDDQDLLPFTDITPPSEVGAFAEELPF